MNRAALRATARIAWRQARLARGRSALIVAMIALPIAALSFGFTIIKTTVPTPEERATADMGTAELILQDVDQGSSAEQLLDDLPPGTTVTGFTMEGSQVVVDGTLVYPTIREPSRPIGEPPLVGMWILERGRFPRAKGEAAVDPSVLELFDVEVGETLEVDDLALRVVGVAVWPLEFWNPNIVVGPGTLDGRRDAWQGSRLIDLPLGADLAAAERVLDAAHDVDGYPAYQTRASYGAIVDTDQAVATAAAFAATAIALFATGLITGAAFAVGMRRQLRTLGLMGAAGAEGRHIRSTVLFSGTTLGSFGATLGAALGIGAAVIVTPHMPRLTSILPGELVVDPLLIVGAIALGTTAATLAAVIPARAASRLSTMDALAMRVRRPRPPGRIALLGVILAGIGAPIAAAGTSSDGGQALSIGVLMMIGGTLLAIPLLVTMVGRVAHRFPLSWRVAARDTARQGRRTGAALAAATLALVFPVGIAAASLSEEAYERSRPRLGAHQILFYNATGDDGVAAAPPAGFVAAVEVGLPGAIAAPVRQTVFRPEVIPAELTEFEGRGGKRLPSEYPVWVQGGAPHETSSGIVDTRTGLAVDAGSMAIATIDLLRALDAEHAIPLLGRGKVLALGGVAEGDLTMYLPSKDENQRAVKLPAVGVEAPRYFNEDVPPHYLIDEQTAAAHGLMPARNPSVTIAWLPHAARDGDLEIAREIASRYEGMYVLSAEDFIPSAGTLRVAATGASALIAVAILGVAVALVYAESRRDQAILGAVGAAPGTRRRIAGANAAILSMIAGILGAVAGFLPVGVIQAARANVIGSGPRPVIVPWIAIAVVVLVVPLVAGLGAALVSRKPRAYAMLQPIV